MGDVIDMTTRILDLRVLGYTVREIAERSGMSAEQVNATLKSGLEKAREYQFHDAVEWQAIELERLDLMQRTIENQVSLGSLEAVSLSLKVSESRRKLLGIDGPVKVEYDFNNMSNAELLQKAQGLFAIDGTAESLAGDGSAGSDTSD